jgi:predicted nucleic acid-binding protein
MTESVVIDANIALKWVLVESDSQIARVLLADWKNKKTIIYVPTLLTYEITNILYREVRAGSIPLETAEDGINLIFRAVSPVFSRNSALNLRALALAKQFGLSAAYDAHYLALAESKQCPFWTADTRMWRAVKDQFDWVYWIGAYTAT